MSYKDFIGIDISKLTIDAYVHGNSVSKSFPNDAKGFALLLNWMKKHLKTNVLTEAMVCFEHTGMYGLNLANYLQQNQVPFAMLPPLQIKQSLGMIRGKNDSIDAKRIAEYAWLRRTTIKASILPARSIIKLQSLLTLRNRLVNDRGGFQATLKDQQHCHDNKDYKSIFDVYKSIAKNLTLQIKKIEKEIIDLIESDEALKKNYYLLIGIRGIGPVIAANMLSCTHNFTRFANWRKFACYVGIAPFEHTSGTSVKGRTRISQLSNKDIKKLLHLAAISACIHDKELKTYYKRRVAEGKNKMSTLNILRNKIVARMFAVINRQSPFVDLMKFAA